MNNDALVNVQIAAKLSRDQQWWSGYLMATAGVTPLGERARALRQAEEWIAGRDLVEIITALRAGEHNDE